MSVKTGEILKLQRSSSYWVGRAARHRREGNRRRAAALLRHALALSPEDVALRAEYAKTLQEMECYEASNRAAFSALTQSAERSALYGLIGRNMLALGHEQEAMDAFARYLWAVKHEGGMAEFDEELDELEDVENDYEGIRARHETQLGIASHHLARGDLAVAERALKRARPAKAFDDRYDSLQALLAQAKGDAQAAVRYATRACRLNPTSARAYCTLSGAWQMLGKRTRSASALLRAAKLCQTPQDERLFCYSAVGLGYPELAHGVLRRALKQSPDRLPALYDASITLLRLGRMEDAVATLHRCRDLDPADVPSRCTAHTVEQWTALALTPAQVRRVADALPFYPLLPPAQSSECLQLLAKVLSEGVEVFCQQLQSDEYLYNLLLYELGNGEHQLGRLLPVIAAGLPIAFAERLLRETLVQPAPDDGVKRYAAAALMSIGATPPFVVWHAGRIAEIDPSVQNRRDMSFSRAMLVRRLADIQRKTGDARLLTHALHLLYRMGARRRLGVVRDANGVFRAALEQHYLLTYRLPNNARIKPITRNTVDERRRVRAVFHVFCKLVPLPKRIDHP